MKKSDKINKWIHYVMVWRVLWAYAKKSKRVEKKHPALFNAVTKELSIQHKTLWSQLGYASGDRWLRLHVNLTGIQDYKFCPEDIFFARIERILNDCNVSGQGVEDKNHLWRYIPTGCEPEVLTRYIRGSFYNAEGKWISEKDVIVKITQEKNDLVGKPCNSSGGNGIRCFKRTGAMFKDGDVILSPKWITTQSQNYVLQRKIIQDDFSASFNQSSINTVRMMTLRCPWNGEVVVLRSMMRMGVTNAVVDNMMKGGICVCIGENGQFGKYAYDYDGQRYEKHPVSGHTFDGIIHPGYKSMVMLAQEIASSIPDFNLLSFDFVPRQDGSICVVEINATSQGITQLQYDFGGLFGEYTEQVVTWCKQHQELDKFNHFRTFY